MRGPRGISRSFWALVALASLGELTVAGLALHSASLELACRWAPLRALGGWPSVACGEPFGLLGYRAWVPALLLVALVATSVSLVMVATLRQGLRTRRAWQELRQHETEAPAQVRAAATVVGLEAPVFLDDDRPCCFCRGFLRPQVAISSGLAGRLDQHSLTAVLAHEAAHARRRDPLRAMVAHGAAAGMFFLPVTADLARGERVAAELGADAAAVKVTGTCPLAQALKVALTTGRPVLGTVAEMASLDALDLRIDALVDPKPLRVRVRLPAALASLGATVVLAALVALGPLTAPATVVVPAAPSSGEQVATVLPPAPPMSRP